MSNTDKLAQDWRAAALRLGEQLAKTGLDNYYGMTPTQWLEWCENNLPSASSVKETAWLIEMPAAQWGTGFYWRGPKPGWSWGTIDEAVRFSRKEDAERIIAELQAEDRNARRKIAYEAREHSWPPYVKEKS